MSESSETQQANIVFMGRESFRMQVVGTPALATDAGAIPSPIWEKTQRIIERRRSSNERRRSINERRQSPPGAAEVDVDLSVLAPARNRIVVLSLIFFAGGALVATAVSRLSRRAGATTSVEAARVTAPTPTPTPPAPASAAAPPAVVVQPLPEPEPTPLPAAEPAIAPPAVDPHPAKRATVAKAPTPARGAASAGLRPRRAPPAPVARAVQPAPFASPAPIKAAGSTRKWVDPFAE